MQPKSKLAAGLFAFLLGFYGVHNFYMGYTGKAVCQLVLAIIGLVLTFIGLILSIFYIVGLCLVIGVKIWVTIEGILILTKPTATDARGVKLEWNP